MLRITIPAQELWDDEREEFINTEEVSLQLEHSLVSVSKWESKWHKPFLNTTNKQSEMTDEEFLDYIRCMTITQNVNSDVDKYFQEEQIRQIADYVKDPMSATWFSKSDDDKPKKQEVLTAEIMYYMMFSYNIPKECEKWHLNKLITLLRVFGEKNKPSKKQSPKQTAKNYAKLNAARRKAMQSKG